MSKIKILVDSTSDIPLEVAEKNGITVLPIKFTIGGKTYNDKFDMSEKDFYKVIRETGEIPVTSQITPLDFENAFREMAKECDEIIAFTISSVASGTFQNANIAKNIVEDETDVKIHLFDGKAFSLAYGHLALKASKMIEENKSVEEIFERLTKIRDSQQVYFGVETLDYLKKGGRIKTATAVIGGMLDIRPMLELKDGLVVSTDKIKGEKKFISKLIDNTVNAYNEIENPEVYLFESDNPDISALLTSKLEEKGIKVDHLVSVGSVIGAHAGPGVYGIMVAMV